MHTIPQVLSPEELAIIQDALTDAEFEDGKLTAGSAIRSIKHNLQLKRDVPDRAALDELIVAALLRHPLFQSLAIPKRVSAPLFGRYEPGMHYGPHVDAPISTGNSPIRTDLSITLFLNPPEAYDGGELTIESPGGPRRIKLPAGDAILYPATSLHQVEPVTRGRRLVAVTWAQSYVRDPDYRAILHDLNAVAASLTESHPNSIELTLIAKAHANLLRKTAEV
jgi:PKHD-type hydroxylase